jgi:predicted alpha/beta-fold hydrolase
VAASSFRPAWWLRGPHAQTLWPTFFRPRPHTPRTVERLELPDGDFLDLAWLGPVDGPLVLVLHGLEGSLDSHYARGLVSLLARRGYRVCFLFFRGCSGEPNRLARSYHSGDTGDVDHLVEEVLRRRGLHLYGAVGYSLGGNVLLKWLGERGASAPLERAAAVSVPFVLDDAARRLGRGVSRIYQRHLLGRLQAKFRRKFAQRPCPVEVDVDRLRTFFAFDDRVTAPLHGFTGVADYYRRSSSRQYLPHIRRPTLILHAVDDPFMYPASIPRDDELPEAVRLELSARGGHVGFVAGPWPWRAGYWAEQRIREWLGGDQDKR